MSDAGEHLGLWWWRGTHPSRPNEPKHFEFVTYVDARAAAARFFSVSEMQVVVRALYEYELEELRARAEQKRRAA